MTRVRSVFVLGGLALVLAACSPAAPAAAPKAAAPAPAVPAPAAAQPNPAPAATAAPARATVHVGVTPLLTVSGLYVAQERGYFDEQAIDVTMENITDASAMVPSLATGQIDVGNGALSAGLWNAIARGADIKLVALQSWIPPGVPGAGYVSRKQDLDSGAIGDYPTIRGKRFSINGRGTYPHIVLAKAAEKGGLTLADVELVDMPQVDAVVAVANGSIDFATVSEPFRTSVLSQGTAVQWKDFNEIVPGQQASAWVYSPQFAAERPDVGRRFMLALLRGIREVYDAFNKDVNREQIIDLITPYLAVRDRGPYMILRAQVHPNGEFDTAWLQGDVDWYVANGFSPERVDVTRSVDRQFVDYAIQQLGRYQQ